MATRFYFKSLETVIESLQCYRCKAFPVARPNGEQRNRYSCVKESHQLCEICKELCSCGSLVGKNPNPVAHQILKDLPMYCPNYGTGCRQFFAQTDDLEDHQPACIFRKVYCPCLHYDPDHGRIVFKDISDHLMKQHSNDLERAKASTSTVLLAENKFVFNLPAYQHHGFTLIPRKIELVNKYDLFFVGKVVNSIMYAWIYIVGSPIAARNYSCTISVTDKSGNKFAFYGQAVKPLDERPKDVIAKQAVFMIGTEVIKNSKDENDKLSIEVTINDLKEEAKDSNDESGVEDDVD